MAAGAPRTYGPDMDASDWLLPQPTTMTPTTGVLNADGSLNGPIFAEFGSMLADELAVRLPAFAEDGSPVIPPDRHILDHLSRAWDLVDGNARLFDHHGKATLCAQRPVRFRNAPSATSLLGTTGMSIPRKVAALPVCVWRRTQV